MGRRLEIELSMLPGTESWGLKDWLEAGSYLVAIILFVTTPVVWLLKRKRTSTATTKQIDIDYPTQGRHGANILSHTFEAISLKTPVSMRAIIPPGRELRVRLTGPKPEYLDQTEGAWYYAMSPINWTGGPYSESLGETFPIQAFTAEAGTADLQITFCRRGAVAIEAFEGSGREPAWKKTIKVTA